MLFVFVLKALLLVTIKMPTIEDFLSSLRLRVEMLKARKPVPTKSKTAFDYVRQRETGKIKNWTFHILLMALF